MQIRVLIPGDGRNLFVISGIRTSRSDLHLFSPVRDKVYVNHWCSYRNEVTSLRDHFLSEHLNIILCDRSTINLNWEKVHQQRNDSAHFAEVRSCGRKEFPLRENVRCRWRFCGRKRFRSVNRKRCSTSSYRNVRKYYIILRTIHRPQVWRTTASHESNLRPI